MFDINKIKSMTVKERLELMEMIRRSFQEEDLEKEVPEEEDVEEEIVEQDTDEEIDEEELRLIQESWEEYEADPSTAITMEEFLERGAKRKNEGK